MIPNYNDAIKLEKIEREHFQWFDKYPSIIGVHGGDFDTLRDQISKSIKDNKPYNERDLLSKEDLKSYNEGNLFF